MPDLKTLSTHPDTGTLAPTESLQRADSPSTDTAPQTELPAAKTTHTAAVPTETRKKQSSPTRQSQSVEEISQQALNQQLARMKKKYPGGSLSEIAEYGIDNLMELLTYLNSPDGKEMQSLLATQAANTKELQMEQVQELQEEKTLSHRLLAFFILHLMASKIKQHQHELEQFLQRVHALGDEHEHDFVERTEESYEEAFDRTDALMEQVEHDYDIAESNENALEQDEAGLDDRYQDLKGKLKALENAGEQMAELFTNLTTQVTTSLESEEETIALEANRQQTASGVPTDPSQQPPSSAKNLLKTTAQSMQQQTNQLQRSATTPPQAVNQVTQDVRNSYDSLREQVGQLRKQAQASMQQNQDTKTHLTEVQQTLSAEKQQIINEYQKISATTSFSETSTNMPTPKPQSS